MRKRNWIWIILILLALVETPLGATANNARRWLNLGFFSFQPSELVKIAVVMFFSASLSKRKSQLKKQLTR